MIAPIDPTGRADRHANRKLIRLLGLLAGVFVVGTGIGWIVGQIGHPVGETAPQNVATSVPASLPPGSTVAGPDTLTPAAAQPAAPQPALPLPQPAAATPSDQHTATSFIAEATQQPPPPAPAAATPPPHVDANGGPAAAPPPPSSPPAVKSEPEVVIEPAQEQVAPPEAPKPTAPAAAPQAKPAAPRPSHTAKAAKHRSAPHRVARHEAAAAASRVTVIGAKGAPAGTRWTIQLGAFRTHDHAALLVMTLQSHGTAAKVVKRDDGAKGVWYVVQTPSIASLKAATTAAAAISRRERVAASVMRAEK